MSSYRQILYHIVFRTKEGQKTLSPSHCQKLFAYIGGIIKNKSSFPYQINGMPDHIHIFSDLHPSIALADFIRDIKTSSSLWMKNQREFRLFRGWSDGYAALTYAWSNKDNVVNYIKNQQEHHKSISFKEEYRSLLEEHGIKPDERYFLI